MLFYLKTRLGGLILVIAEPGVVNGSCGPNPSCPFPENKGKSIVEYSEA